MDNGSTDNALSHTAALVRRHDPDRFFTALFAPPPARDALFTLYAFNHELARAREVAREPFAALIRLQWWRDILEGARPGNQVATHPVATALLDAIVAGTLSPAHLEPLVTAREAEAEPFDTLAALEAYALAAQGGLMVAAAHALGWPGAETLRPWGAAYGLVGLVGSIPAHARQGRCLLPADLLREAGLSDGAVIAAPNAPALAPIRARLAAIARSWAAQPAQPPRAARPAALPALLARRRLRNASPAWDRLALTRAALFGL